jgi:hypothetical protein
MRGPSSRRIFASSGSRWRYRFISSTKLSGEGFLGSGEGIQGMIPPDQIGEECVHQFVGKLSRNLKRDCTPSSGEGENPPILGEVAQVGEMNLPEASTTFLFTMHCGDEHWHVMCITLVHWLVTPDEPNFESLCLQVE